MAFFLRHIARMAVQKLASDPVARGQAVKAAQTVTDEVRKVAAEDNKPYAAGRSVRRMLNKLRDEKSS